MDKNINVAEAAVIIGVTPGRIRQLISSNTIDFAEKIGKVYIMPKSKVVAFAKKKRPAGRRNYSKIHKV